MPAKGESEYARAEAWAKRVLPDEHAPFAAFAAMSLKLGRWPVNAESVLKKLQRVGQDRASIDALAERYKDIDKRGPDRRLGS